MSERSDNIGKTRLSDRSMDIAEVLKLVDEVLFTNTGEHPKARKKKDGKRRVFPIFEGRRIKTDKGG
ncbi:hypothetical protein IQ270_27000 [Microcoleus sp. LEGE 07076]|uniref:hypothetical protein n=1 Tax=Microcoleus sp. LEGE 07076 TaxID=915322 RepID=UPI0018830E0C|nr:hypothetical protein [Microcoleus sp. LEGE 07076]MBE9188187.1 hypothetical protein [Microcoleus sp. LEGE 07076]